MSSILTECIHSGSLKMSSAMVLRRLARTGRCTEANRVMTSASYNGLAVYDVASCSRAFSAQAFTRIESDPNSQVPRAQRSANGWTAYSVLRGLATSGTTLDVSATSVAKSLPSLAERPGRLTATQEMQIQQYRHSLQDLLRAVELVDGVASADVALLKGQLDRLSDGLFLLVVVGEYNSGKSSFINALLGQKIVAEGPVPTTAEVTVIRYAEDGGASNTRAVGSDGVAVISQNVDLLRTITLVDSPGTNAIDRRHEALTKEYLPMCDLVLFVTSADRPFSESERVFLKSIRSWGKKCILVINKADLLPDTAVKNEVLSFVKSSSRALLGSSPQIFSVSSRHAFEAKTSATGTHGPHWDASGFEALESFIGNRLNADERLRIKLESVASVGSAVGKKYVSRLHADKDIIAADQAALDDVKDLVDRCEQAVAKGFSAQFARVDNALLEFLDRADLFLDNHGKHFGTQAIH
jgi:small GTP-binding protein